MSVPFKDYYASLGVARDAGDDEIKKAFRKLARQYHPDVAKDTAGAEEKFKEINEAYEVLGDTDKRAKYDRLGPAWQQSGGPSPWQGAGGAPDDGFDPNAGADAEFHFGGTGFSDFFEQYFSGGTRYGFPPGAGTSAGYAQAGGSRRGSDIEGDILVTLHEALHGTLRPITLQMLNRQTGKAETREFQVRIPPGATDGRRIRVPGQGEPGHGGAPAGDLFLTVRHAAHPDFTTEGSDILHELDIAPWEAVLGAVITVPALDGNLKLKIPAGAENDQRLRVRGHGLPKGKSGGRGDYYAVLKVRLPDVVTDAERELWQKLRDASSFNPRLPR